MRKRLLLIGAALVGAAALAAGAESSAQQVQPSWIMPERGARFERAQASVRPVREIVEMVRRQRGGELVDVLRLEQNADPPFYVLRWRFDNGVVADLRVNAVTGRIMG